MKTVFIIDGGAGRVITSIPALIKYSKNNPDDDFKICIHGWDSLLWGIPELQDKVFNLESKGIFENIFLEASRVIFPEPYRLPAYYRQEKSLVEAFDYLINDSNDHTDLPNITLPISKGEEMNTIIEIDKSQKEEFRKNKLNIVIQPWGSTAKKINSYIIDESSRSMESWCFQKLIKKLSKNYNLFLFSDRNFWLENEKDTLKFEGDLRFWSSLIFCSDYFIGIDSVGQHIAKAHNIPGTVILGSTFAENVSYPNHFNIFEKKGNKKYSPLRINGIDPHLADRINNTRMDFSDEEIDELVKSIEKDIQLKVKNRKNNNV